MRRNQSSAAGKLLYRHLPEEYRYRDNATDEEAGDLEAYLHGFGYVLDRIRGTIEQMHADSFAEPLSESNWSLSDAGKVHPQAWVLPYLAELIGANLTSPDSEARARELNETASWFKAKGTLSVIDSIADTVANVETVIVEGWTRTLTTPRLYMPPFATAPVAPVKLPLGTPDLRHCARAIKDPSNLDPLSKFTLPGGGPPVQWRIHNRRGAPCFPGSYEDTSLRTVDVRSVDRGGKGPHPNLIVIHVQPPEGLFTSVLSLHNLPANHTLGLVPGQPLVTLGPAEVMLALGLPVPINPPKRLALKGNFTVPENTRVTFSDILFFGDMVIPRDSRVWLERCAVARIALSIAEAEPALFAQRSLVGQIDAALGYAQLEFVTVLNDSAIGKVQASDCIFAGNLTDFSCSKDSCLRYARLGKPIGKQDCGATISFGPVLFQDRDLKNAAGKCERRVPQFGEPGCGLLAHDADEKLRLGSEDGGEIGAFHHLNYAAALSALTVKLESFMPAGLEAVAIYDPRLAIAPPKLIGATP